MVDIRDGVSIGFRSTLLANFPAIPGRFAEGDATVVIHGDVFVGRSTALVLGCSSAAGCVETTGDRVFGDIRRDQALGIIVHSSRIEGDVFQSGGGGGVLCTPSGIFTVLGSPVYSTYEDDHVLGRMQLTDLRSCWLGQARDEVGGSMALVANTLADPEAIEVLSNRISDHLLCEGNSMVWDSAEASQGQPGLYPRVPEPNSVDGRRIGQCHLASLPSPGAPPGPGPF